MITAYEAKRRLVALLEALTGPAEALEGVTILRNTAAHREDLTVETIYLGRVSPPEWATEGRQAPRTLGNGKRTESYSLELVVTNVGEVSDAATEDRNEELVDAVEQAVFADPQLGGLLQIGIWLSEFDLVTDSISDPRAWQSTATLRFACQALISP